MSVMDLHDVRLQVEAVRDPVNQVQAQALAALGIATMDTTDSIAAAHTLPGDTARKKARTRVTQAAQEATGYDPLPATLAHNLREAVINTFVEYNAADEGASAGGDWWRATSIKLEQIAAYARRVADNVETGAGIAAGLLVVGLGLYLWTRRGR